MSDGHYSRSRGRPGWLRGRGLTAGLVGTATVAAFLVTAGTANAVPGTSPVGAAGIVPAGAARIGTVPSNTKVSIDVVLNPTNAAGLSKYATEVATPGSSLYHRYLAKGQFAKLFGASGATVSTVLSSLRSLGLHPGIVAADRLSIPVTATAAQVESAFGVNLANYRVDGKVAFSNTNAPRLPAAIAGSVEDIIGLDNTTPQQHFSSAPSAASLAGRKVKNHPAGEPTGGPQPCPTLSNAGAEFGSFTADQFAFAYDFSPLYKAGDFGSGVGVGIVEFGEPDSPTDIADYQECYGTNTKVSYDKVDHFNQHGPGEGEAALDIETVIGLAPKVSIKVYQAPNTGNAPYDVYRTIVDQDTVRVVSESYGLCEHYQQVKAVNAVTVLYEQAAVQGQTIVASSGDAGSEACLPNDGVKTRLSVNFPASDPLVLGIGGTRINDLAERPGEAVWNEGLASEEGAGGGGTSGLFGEPSWQKSFGIKSKVREVPDVSADADPATGYMIVYKGQPMPIGGTSAAAPLWASLLALTDAKCSESPVGWANPAIYYAASPHVKAVVIDDIPRVSDSRNNNDYTGKGHGKYPVEKGYDMATGIGSPIGATLATELCSLSSEAQGYWLATSDGHVYAEHAPFSGSLAGKHLASKVVAIAGDPKTNGYWLVTAKGAVSPFNAPSNGSVKGGGSNIVGIASDASGSGYWVVNSNGHVYSFGAPSLGSVKHPSGTVVGIASDTQSNGYWVVTSTGHVYAFRAKVFAGKKLSGVTGIAADPHKQGYWLTTSGGKVFGFGVPWEGNMPFNVGKVIGIAGDGGPFTGYFLATSNGHVGAIGSEWHGDHPGSGIVGIAGSR